MKKTACVIAFLAVLSTLSAEESTAYKIAEKAVSEPEPKQAAEYVENQIKNVSDSSEKRVLYAFEGSIWESVSEFEKACDCYVKAAGTAGGNVSGFPKKSSEQLVIDAVRCALSAGEGTIALNYLNSSVRNSKNEEIQAYIKLYEQWAALSNAEKTEDTKEAVSMLNAYISLDSMKSVKTSMLLTLWYITGESSYAETLKKEFPSSTETGIVTGKVQVLPSPFWYFVPRDKKAEIVQSSEAKNESSVKAVPEENSEKALVSEEKESNEESGSKAVRLQLGLFRDKANADTFKSRLSEKGFNAYIQEETRSSGTTYYIVVVDENKNGDMGTLLKTAGFESYPIY